MSAKLLVSKLEAGKRLLETAIILYFNYGDPVSIHSLCSAAHAIFRDLSARRAGKTQAKDLWQFVDEHVAKQFQRLISQGDNLFKDAHSDLNGLELDPRTTEAVMLDAVKKYWQLSGEQPSLPRLYVMWLVTRHPEIFGPQREFDAILQTVGLNRLPKDRHQYFTEVLPVVASLLPPIVAAIGTTPNSPASKSMDGTAQIPLTTFAENERELIARALQSTGGNKRRAAKLLQISRKMLYNKIEKYRLLAAVALYREQSMQRQPSSPRSNSPARSR